MRKGEQGRGASEFREFIRSLPDLVDAARERGQPIAMPDPGTDHGRRLYRTLGVDIEGGAMSTASAEALSGHDVAATMDCREHGCPNEAPARGRYAGRCPEHRGKPSPARPRSTSNGEGFAGDVKALLPLARAVDRAKKRLESLPDPQEVQAELAEAMRRAQGSATAENLARLEDAAHASRESQAPRERRVKDLSDAELEFKAALARLAHKAAGR